MNNNYKNSNINKNKKRHHNKKSNYKKSNKKNNKHKSELNIDYSREDLTTLVKTDKKNNFVTMNITYVNPNSETYKKFKSALYTIKNNLINKYGSEKNKEDEIKLRKKMKIIRKNIKKKENKHKGE